MAGRISAALAASRLSRRGSPALTSLLAGSAAAARDVAPAALCPPWARAAAGLRGRDFCAAGSGDSSSLPRCAACGTTLSAAWTQGLLNAAVRARTAARGTARVYPRAPARRAASKATPRVALGHFFRVAYSEPTAAPGAAACRRRKARGAGALLPRLQGARATRQRPRRRKRVLVSERLATTAVADVTRDAGRGVAVAQARRGHCCGRCGHHTRGSCARR